VQGVGPTSSLTLACFACSLLAGERGDDAVGSGGERSSSALVVDLVSVIAGMELVGALITGMAAGVRPLRVRYTAAIVPLDHRTLVSCTHCHYPPSCLTPHLRCG
jgi:hypothetical protein